MAFFQRNDTRKRLDTLCPYYLNLHYVKLGKDMTQTPWCPVHLDVWCTLIRCPMLSHQWDNAVSPVRQCCLISETMQDYCMKDVVAVGVQCRCSRRKGCIVLGGRSWCVGTWFVMWNYVARDGRLLGCCLWVQIYDNFLNIPNIFWNISVKFMLNPARLHATYTLAYTP